MAEDTQTTLPPQNTPQEGTYYYRTLWGSYKGHVMGMFRGMLSGLLLGAVIGAAIFSGAGLLGLGVFGSLGIAPVVAAFAGLGSLFAGSVMGGVGTSAGAAAATHAEEEMRMRYPGSTDGISYSLDSPTPGFGHHYEVPEDRDKGTWFHPKVGIPVMVVGAAIGALLGFGLPAVALGALHIGGTAVSGVLAGGLLGGLFGGSYGVDRSKFKSIFNYTDEWLNGKVTGPSKIGKAKEDAILNMTEEEAKNKLATPSITTMQRQEEYTRLYYQYFDKSFWSGMLGNMRGVAGGATVGGLLGAAIGGLIVAALTVATGGLGAAAGWGIVAAVTGLGIREGIHVFADTGIQASTQAAAREALDIKKERIRDGLNPEPTPAPEKKSWFNPKVMIIGLIVGALLGGPLGLGIAHAIGIEAIGGMAAAALGAMTCGLMGSTFGIEAPAFKQIANGADALYTGSWIDPTLSHDGHARDVNVPYMAPDSPLQPKAKTVSLANQPDVNVPSPAMQQRLNEIIASRQTPTTPSISKTTVEQLAQQQMQQGAVDSTRPTTVNSLKSAVEREAERRNTPVVGQLAKL